MEDIELKEVKEAESNKNVSAIESDEPLEQCSTTKEETHESLLATELRNRQEELVGLYSLKNKNRIGIVNNIGRANRNPRSGYNRSTDGRESSSNLESDTKEEQDDKPEQRGQKRKASESSEGESD